MEDKAIVGGSPEQEKRTPFFMNLASGLLTVLLGLVSELFVTLVFLWRIAREFTFAGFAGFRSGQIRSFLASVFPMLICFVLFALIAFALIMLNRRRWKVLLRIFSAALVIAAFTGIVVAYSTKNLDNGAFYTTDGYRSMIYLTGIGFLIAAAIVLSVSLCFEHEGILRKLLMFFIQFKS